ncbi:MAG: ABC transporter ATP-binding protein [Clostridia bacterium]|nr:ABC transporter ATP-binding protein [Clostridia bacterium]
MYILQTKDLSVGYQGKALLRDIRISLRQGQILTLIGPNGAGKSTLLKTLTRQLAPIAGSIRIGGQELSSIPAQALARRMSVVLTERVQPEMMTCYDVAAMGRYPYTGRFGTLTKKDHAIVQSTLRRVRAEEIADQDFSRVSDGQRQRVLLARALCQEPELLVLDEPTSFLDIRHKIDLLDILLEESRERRLTVVLSLHEIDLAEKISDLVMCVQGDSVCRVGAPGAVFTDENIAQLYGLEQGSYLVSRGSVELSRPDGDPRVFVIGGAGYGMPFYRALQKRRVPFAAGILYENDLEFEVARALAARVISQAAFTPIDAEALEDAKQAVLRCRAVLDAGAPRGPLNAACEKLLSFAKANGIKVIRHAEELD